jgi:hypothetical protein
MHASLGRPVLVKEEFPSVVESVVLVEHPSDVVHQVLGPVRAALRSKSQCRDSLEIRAAMKRANAVLGVVFHRRPMLHTTLHEARGIAARVQESDSLLELKSQWMERRCGSLRRTMLWLGGTFLGLQHAFQVAGARSLTCGCAIN